MDNKTVEVELKALVSNLTEVQTAIESRYDMSRTTKIYSEQLNHYFNHTPESLNQVLYNYAALDAEELNKITKAAVRTRWDSVKGTLLIIKYSLVDSNSENGSIRKEYELPVEATLEELDNNLLSYGLTYQSKWGRKRTEYKFEETEDRQWSLCLDSNYGYGSLLEVECMATEDYYNQNKDYILMKANKFLTDLGLVELDSVLLDNMFQFYSSRYDDFYQTDKLIWDDPGFNWTREGNLKVAPKLTDMVIFT